MNRVNWMEKIAGKGAADKAKQKRFEAMIRRNATQNGTKYEASAVYTSSPTKQKCEVTTQQDVSKRDELVEDEKRDSWDPCNLSFHYFSGAECAPVSPTPTAPTNFFRRPERPMLYRSQSELMPKIQDSDAMETQTPQWGGPDPTCYEVPEDRLQRTHSSSAVWDSPNFPLVPLPYTIGIGCYRRDPNTSPEWCKEKYKSHVSLLGSKAAHECGAFELAGIEPELNDLPRKESFASHTSNCSTSSQYSELVDEQGRITRVYRGFAASAYPAALSATQESRDVRHDASSLTTDLGDRPYSRQAIRPRSRVSFLRNPEQLDSQAPRPVIAEETPVLASRTKSSVTLKLATPGHAESAIDSDDEGDWVETTPQIPKKPAKQQHKFHGERNQAGKRALTGKAGDHKSAGPDRIKATMRKPAGAAIRRRSSHDKPISRRSASDEKKSKAKVQLACAEDRVEAVRSEANESEHVRQKLDSLDLSVVSNGESKIEKVLADLKEEDTTASSSSSSERTAMPSIKFPSYIARARRNRSGTAILACSIKVPQIPEATEDSEMEKI
ncbi:MAG: hypothetical protein Q9160_007497 [Pyrenula sp. 1 TL-2023]